MKQIHISELMPLVQSVQGDLADWTVGFVKAIETSKGNYDGVLAGSGVLVTGNGRHAILTARQYHPSSIRIFTNIQAEDLELALVTNR